MTLKEEEITRKEMAKILPTIQIGHIDKNVKEYLNNTIDDMIEEETKETSMPKSNADNLDEKTDLESENKFKEDFESVATELKSGLENASNEIESKDTNVEEDIPSSAADDVNSFLNNLLHQVDVVNNRPKL